MGRVDGERRRLRRAMRDLVALSALPAVWAGCTPARVAEDLADVLVRMLHLDFICIRLEAGAGVAVTRAGGATGSSDAAGVLGEALAPWLAGDAPGCPPSLPDPRGEGMVRLAAVPLGSGRECGALVAGSGRDDFPTREEELLLGVGANQAAIVIERKRQALRLQALADASLQINASLSVAQPLNATLQVVTDRARELLGAHLAVTSMTVDLNWSQAITAVSLSDKYAAWRSYDELPDGTGIYALVCGSNRAMRLTQDELVSHPAFRGFGKAAERHPRLRGWLAVPLVGKGGGNLGLLQLSDKYEGEFTAEDEAVAAQLAAVAAVAVENHGLYRELQEAARRKDEFLATLSHELRNPLAPLRNSVRVLGLHAPAEPQVRWARDVIERQVEQMARLVDDLLDVSRTSRGKVVLRKEVVDLAAVVGRAVETTRPLIEERRHELTVSLPPGPAPLEADPTRLEQVLGNLLNNAAKYTEPGGRVWLTAEREPGGIVIRVGDTGIGMTPDFVARAFDMFSQAEQGRDHAGGGLGIGLSLVRSLVAMHGGTVTARSAGPSQGSEFTVRLPAVEADGGAGTKLRGADERRPGGPARRVLIVDDNKDGAQSLAMLLRMMGNDVHTTYDGPSALEAAGAYPPDVVLLDIGLPGMSGHDVARRLRKEPGLEGVVLVAVTGWGQEEDRRLSREAGFDSHMVKPIDVDALQELMAVLEPPAAG